MRLPDALDYLGEKYGDMLDDKFQPPQAIAALKAGGWLDGTPFTGDDKAALEGIKEWWEHDLASHARREHIDDLLHQEDSGPR